MELQKYREYCRLIENMIYRVGIWPHPEDTGPLYRLVAYYGLFLCGVLGLKAVVHGFNNITNLTVFMRAFRGTIALLSPMIRMTFYLRRRKDLVSLDKDLTADFEEKLKNEENQLAMLKPISLYKYLTQLLNFTFGIAALTYYLPYVIVIFKYKKSVQVFQGKHPFAVKPRGVLYWIIFAFESSAIWYIYRGVAGVDNDFGMHCFRIAGFLRLATERLGKLEANHPNCKDRLRECVKMHQLVLRAKIVIQRIYGVLTIYNYLISAMVMCSLLWQANQMTDDMSVINLFYAVVFIAMKLIQTFIYAYIGSSITTESENYQKSVYRSNWPGSGNVKLMKDLLIVGTQRTVSLKACGYFLITMEFFDKICHTSISYFFLIQTLDQKNN